MTWEMYFLFLQPRILACNMTVLDQAVSKFLSCSSLLRVCVCHAQLCPISWTVAHQAPLSMGFSRQEYWSGLPFSTLGDLSDPGIEP